MSTRKGLEFSNMKRFHKEFLIFFLFLLVILAQWILYRSGRSDAGTVPVSVFTERSGDSMASAPLNIVDLNAASAEEFRMLPGIGSVIAERIVKYREENGPFSSVEEIKSVSGIGEETYSNIVDFITVR